ncbi:hypothetical protein D9M69_504290 [compost metagenome]
MSDRRLLEMAARAEGRQPPYDAHGVFTAWVGDTENGHWWNPLDDDGDALRLAMTLDICIHLNREELTVICQSWRPNGLFKIISGYTKDTDVRRCIVGVAAKIGAGKPDGWAKP